MNILMLTDHIYPENRGGAPRMVWELLRQYVKDGHSVNVFIPTEYLRFNVRWRNWRGICNPKALRALRKCLLDNKRFDVIHVHNVHGAISWASIRTCKKYGAKVIVTLHDCMSFVNGKHMPGEDTSLWGQLKRDRLRFNPFRNSCIRKYLSYADRVVAISYKQAGLLKKHGVLVDSVIHNGIDISRWNNTATNTGKFYLYLGGMKKEKGIDEAIQKAKRDGVELISLWDENYEKIFKYYAACSMVLIPTLCVDCSSVVALEAQAMGKPIWKSNNVGDYATGENITIERCANEYYRLMA